MGYIKERKNYTRIGMPVADYSSLLNDGILENANQYNNPESIHSWCADKVSEEFALLKLIGEEEARRHLRGDIHIHMLRYFDLRPFCQQWDCRLILKHGLPPTMWAHSAVSKPANNSMVAVLHLAKWLGIVQGEFSGGQGYDNFTAFLAPYVRGLPYKSRHRNDQSVLQMAQCFLFETNQIYAARGAQVPFTSISCVPSIPNSLKDVPAVSFGGKIDGTYGDYEDECQMLFDAFADVYTQGDGYGKMFNFPKHEIKLNRDWIKKKEDSYLKIMKEAAKFGSPYFLNMMTDWLPEEVHSQCCRLILSPDSLKEFGWDASLFEWATSYINLGSLQSVSINLPRCAYDAKGDDDRLFEILKDRLYSARNVLLTKRSLIKKGMKSELIPMCSSKIEGTPLLDLRKQSLSVGFVGLNECVLAHTGEELHESDEAFEFGKKIVQFLSDTCREFTENTMIHFSLWEQPAESTAQRFAVLDRKHYPNEARVQGDTSGDSIYYTNSGHLRYSANVPLWDVIRKQGELHPIVQGGVITHIWLGESSAQLEGLWKLTKNIANNTPTAYFAYTMDFSQCINCGHFQQGVLDDCPKCGAGEEAIEIWSRITGYYSRVKRYNMGKKQEWEDRSRYSITA
jgi:ribonucleoside-triphosphate reductase